MTFFHLLQTSQWLTLSTRARRFSGSLRMIWSNSANYEKYIVKVSECVWGGGEGRGGKVHVVAPFSKKKWNQLKFWQTGMLLVISTSYTITVFKITGWGSYCITVFRMLWSCTHTFPALKKTLVIPNLKSSCPIPTARKSASLNNRGSSRASFLGSMALYLCRGDTS